MGLIKGFQNMLNRRTDRKIKTKQDKFNRSIASRTNKAQVKAVKANTLKTTNEAKASLINAKTKAYNVKKRNKRLATAGRQAVEAYSIGQAQQTERARISAQTAQKLGAITMSVDQTGDSNSNGSANSTTTSSGVSNKGINSYLEERVG